MKVRKILTKSPWLRLSQMEIEDKDRQMASSAWSSPRTKDIALDPNLAEEVARIIAMYRDALIWCSGSEDFGPGGKAEKGWNNICRPLIEIKTH
jgi:hypothetical protein